MRPAHRALRTSFLKPVKVAPMVSTRSSEPEFMPTVRRRVTPWHLLLALLTENDGMAPDTTPAESPGHWNYGSENRKPLDPSLYDEHWYKRPMPVVAAAQSRWWRLVAFLRRECRC